MSWRDRLLLPVDRPIPPRVEKHLLQPEVVIFCRRQHAVVWLRPVVLVLVAFVAGGWLLDQEPSGALDNLVGFGWLAAVGYAFWQFLEWQLYCFVVTDRRVMLFHGVLTRKIAMMPNQKVTDLTYQQTLVGSLLRYGDLILESAGQDQALHKIAYLPHPYKLYRDISLVLFYGLPALESEASRPED